MDVMPKKWIFLRGLARETRHWGDFPKLFEESFPETEVTVLEIPGVGKKYDQDAPLHLNEYADLLREEYLQLKHEKKSQGNNESWGVLAISMGAMIAMDWMSRYSEDFNAIVLINSSAGNLSPLQERFSLKAMGMVSHLFFKEDYIEREEAILNLTTNRLQITKDFVEKYASYSQEYPIKRKNFIKQMAAASRFKVPLSLVVKPIILGGAKDALANPNCSSILAKHFNVKLHQDSESGHDLPLDNPQWIIETLKSIFQKENNND